MRKTIVLAADNKYLIPLETTIKSIMCHNTEVDLYVLNSDIAPEWFKLLRPRLAQLDSTIHNVRLDEGLFQGYKTGPHLNYASYFRLCIPDVIDSDRAVYFDSDIIINGDLTPLFELDMQGKVLAAVDDIYAHEGKDKGFNSGMLVIDSKEWRNRGIVEELLVLAAEKNQELHLGDQSVLNLYFENQWYELDEIYNSLVGTDIYKLGEDLERVDANPPVVAHFASHDKPWNTYSISRLRELWWWYYGLDWKDIIDRHLDKDYFQMVEQSQKAVFIFTWSLEIEHLRYLIESLPDWHFHIAAPVYCAAALANHSVYPNVTLYQSMFWKRMDWLLDDSQVLLDINHGGEVGDVITKAKEKGKFIFAFDNTRHRDEDAIYDAIFSHEHPEDLVQALKHLK